MRKAALIERSILAFVDFALAQQAPTAICCDIVTNIWGATGKSTHGDIAWPAPTGIACRPPFQAFGAGRARQPEDG
jgi:hypothetical protein